jgi:predicted nucleic acid-binding protein
LRFWDTSAIVPLLVAEPESGTMKALAGEEGDIVAWWGTRAECVSALGRGRREGVLSGADVTNARALLNHLGSNNWAEMQPTQRVRALAERFVDAHPLKAADAMQLAAAFRWAAERPRGYEFVSLLDGPLRRAAAAEGFTVLPTEAP